jgi:hypothetical protein
MRQRGINDRVTFLMVGWATPAASFTGVELFDLRFRKGAYRQLACTSYVRGFADDVAFEGGDVKYCPPQSLPGKEIRLIVEK